MGYYKDLREHIRALEAGNKLVRIKSPVNKDTELNPLVRWQFQGLPESERKAFLFENVTDSRGRGYNIPVLVASHGASTEVYAIGMMCQPAEIAEKWNQAQLHPIAPTVVAAGPCQEEVHVGDRLLEHGGLEEFPIPISTPGFDNAPYLTAANWISKDLDTGIRNVGNYRGMAKSPTRLGILCELPAHLRRHWEKARARGLPLEAAIAIGASPNVGLVATVKVPYDADELRIAGGIAGEPVEVVKCLTVNIEVPATAEIVIEGELPTNALEPEGPFGEAHGYMGPTHVGPYFNVKCITHRKNPIYNAMVSQFSPSESTKLREVGNRASYYKFLRHDCSNSCVLDVAFPESCASQLYCVVQINKTAAVDPWQVLNGVVAYNSATPKVVVVVDKDIDPNDMDAVNWAISTRVQPHRDTRIIMGRMAQLDLSSAPARDKQRRYPMPLGNSALLIDATCKWEYPPTSLPKKEFMDRARQIWEAEGLPQLNPRAPWFGVSLGDWAGENETEADMAVRGDYFLTGAKYEQRREQT